MPLCSTHALAKQVIETLPVQFALVILEMDYLPGLASNQDPLISVFQGARITVIEPQTLSQRPLQ
jgi:hypothetical protein